MPATMDKPKRRRGEATRLSRHTLAALLLAVAFAAAAYLIEYRGGQGVIPSWGQLHALFDVQTELAQPLPSGQTSVTVLDVGQGDAVLLGQDGVFCLIDAGPPEAAETLVNALQQAGVERLHLLVMTHPHADHIGGMESVLQNFAVDAVLLPDFTLAENQTDAMLYYLERAIQQNGARSITAVTGTEYAIGSATLTVLQAGIEAEESGRDDAVNNTSLCLRFEAGDFSFLDTGDAEAAAEEALVEQYGGALHCTLLKAGHHGSSTSNTAALLAAASPQAVAVSCGKDNDYGHPHKAVLQRLEEVDANVYRTDVSGTLVFTAQDFADALPADNAA